MPKKYWSKIKDTSNRSSMLQNLRADPAYLFKTLYDCSSEVTFNSSKR